MRTCLLTMAGHVKGILSQPAVVDPDPDCDDAQIWTVTAPRNRTAARRWRCTSPAGLRARSRSGRKGGVSREPRRAAPKPSAFRPDQQRRPASPPWLLTQAERKPTSAGRPAGRRLLVCTRSSDVGGADRVAASRGGCRTKKCPCGHLTTALRTDSLCGSLAASHDRTRLICPGAGSSDWSHLTTERRLSGFVRQPPPGAAVGTPWRSRPGGAVNSVGAVNATA